MVPWYVRSPAQWGSGPFGSSFSIQM